MLFIYISVTILYFDSCIPKRVPGIPRKHVRVLDDLISKYIDPKTVYQNSTVDLILGGMADDTGSILDNQDINILDHKALKNIIDVTKTRTSNERLLNNSRKYFHETDLIKALGYNYYFPHETEYIIDKAFEMMKQSIYATRYRLNDTNAIRRLYKMDPAYNMAILIGNIHQIVMKCDNLIGQMKKLPKRTHFLHPLLMYERILAGNIDITYLTQRVFLYDKIAQNLFKDDGEESGRSRKRKGFTKIYGPPKDDAKNKPPKPQGATSSILDDSRAGLSSTKNDRFKNNTN